VSTEPASFVVELTQREGFAFDVRFDWPDAALLRVDEPPPLGHASGPNAARLVAAAVANCLSASLLFCLATKFHDAPGPLRATATAHLARNDQGRMRIAGIDVIVTLAETGDVLAPQSLRYLSKSLPQSSRGRSKLQRIHTDSA
jgi:hypothetical protein